MWQHAVKCACIVKSKRSPQRAGTRTLVEWSRDSNLKSSVLVQRRSADRSGGRPVRRNSIRREPYNANKFLQANFKFLVSDAADLRPHCRDADLMLDWGDVLEVQSNKSSFAASHLFSVPLLYYRQYCYASSVQKTHLHTAQADHIDWHTAAGWGKSYSRLVFKASGWGTIQWLSICLLFPLIENELKEFSWGFIYGNKRSWHQAYMCGFPDANSKDSLRIRSMAVYICPPPDFPATACCRGHPACLHIVMKNCFKEPRIAGQISHEFTSTQPLITALQFFMDYRWKCWYPLH